VSDIEARAPSSKASAMRLPQFSVLSNTERQEVAERLKSTFEQLRKRRDRIEKEWVDAARYIAPSRQFKGGEIMAHHDMAGKRRGTDVYDGSPVYYVNQMVNGLIGQTANPAQEWARFTVRNPEVENDVEVQAWAHKFAKHIYAQYRRANFYEELGPTVEDGATICTATMHIDDDLTNDMPVFTAIHPYAVYIDENRHHQVDTWYRPFQMSARNAIEMFPGDRLSDRLVKSAEDPKTHLDMFEFLHVVEPRKGGDHPLDPLRMPFASWYMEINEKDVIEEGGHVESPYVTWRWRKNSGEVYGRGPGLDALVDVMTLNHHAKNMLTVGDLAAKPPYQIPREMRGREQIRPDGRNYYDLDANRMIRPLVTGVQYPIGKDLLDDLRNIIRQHYLVDFFVMMQVRQGKTMTATEVEQLRAEQANVLGPTVARQSSELYDPMFQRVMVLEMRSGRMPAPPDAVTLSGVELDIEYVGALFQAQKDQVEMGRLNRTLAEAAQVFQIKPETMDKVNWDSWIDLIFERNGLSQDLIFDMREVAERRKSRAEATAEQTQLNQEEQIANTDAARGRIAS